MKKLFLMAAAAAMIFASCSKEQNTPLNDSKEGNLTIQIAGASSATRAVGAHAEEDGTEIENGYIFVFNPDGDFVHGESLNITSAQLATGQTLTQPVPSVSTVYIVGNIPGGLGTLNSNVATIFGSLTPDQETVLAATSTLTNASALVTDADAYESAPLANSDGEPAAIAFDRAGANEGDRDIYKSVVQLSPLVSRLELFALQGDSNEEGENGETEENGTIVGFKVTGVFVDDYRTAFTYNGFGSGAAQSMGVNIANAGIYKDEATWSANDDETTGVFVATPGGTDVWAYNVVPGLESSTVAPVSRLIIRLEDVVWRPDGGAANGDNDQTLEVRYLTVNGYNGVTKFERNKIYRIGGEEGITFSIDDLGFTPNPTDVTLFVTVSVIDWVLVEPDAIL